MNCALRPHTFEAAHNRSSFICLRVMYRRKIIESCHKYAICIVTTDLKRTTDITIVFLQRMNNNTFICVPNS